MIEILTKKINWNQNKINKITSAATSMEGKNLLTIYGNKIYNDAKPKLPVDMNGRRNPKVTPLKEAIKVYSPTLKTATYKGQKYKGYQLQIKPKKRQIYYFVVMAGHRKDSRSGKKIIFNYSNPSATNYPLEKAKQKEIKNLRSDFEKVVIQIAKREGT